MTYRDRGNHYAPMYTCDSCGRRRASNNAWPPGWREVRVKVVGGRRPTKHYCTDLACRAMADRFGIKTDTASG